MSDRYFYMILKETIPGKNLHDPLCQRKEGKAPQEVLANDLFAETKPVKIDTSIEEMEEFYGDEDFNEEELAELNDEFREEQGEDI